MTANKRGCARVHRQRERSSLVWGQDGHHASRTTGSIGLHHDTTPQDGPENVGVSPDVAMGRGDLCPLSSRLAPDSPLLGYAGACAISASVACHLVGLTRVKYTRVDARRGSQ